MARAGILIVAALSAVLGVSFRVPDTPPALWGTALLEEEVSAGGSSGRSSVGPYMRKYGPKAFQMAVISMTSWTFANQARNYKTAREIEAQWPQAWRDKMRIEVRRNTAMGMPLQFVMRDRRTGEKVNLRSAVASNTEEWSAIRSATAMLRSVQGPGIIKLLDAAEAQDENAFTRTMLLINEIDNGTLYWQVVGNHRRVALKTKLQLCADLLQGLQRLSEAGVVHRAVSPKVISVYGDCASPKGCRARLGHFSKACYLDERHPSCNPDDSPDAVGPSKDMLQAGVVLYSMLFGQVPRVAPDPRTDPNLHTLEGSLSPLAELLARMLEPDASRRCTAAEALHELDVVAAMFHVNIDHD